MARQIGGHMYDPKEDVREFGENVWIYCGQHMRPHTTGWCTVSMRHKVKLNAISADEAYAECKQKGLSLYSDKRP